MLKNKYNNFKRLLTETISHLTGKAKEQSVSRLIHC